MADTNPLKASLGEFFASQAGWRSVKAEEYPEDRRNAETVAAINRLNEFLRLLPDEDTRLVALGAMQQEGDVYGASEEGALMVSRFGGFDKWSSEEEFFAAFAETEIRADAKRGIELMEEEMPDE